MQFNVLQFNNKILMKKIFILTLMGLLFVGCGNNSNSGKTTESEIDIEAESMNEGTHSINSTVAPDSYQSKYRNKKCSVWVENNTKRCNCSGFDAQNWDASLCRKCGHKAVKHTR